MNPPSIDHFRILLVDDEEEEIRSQIEELFDDDDVCVQSTATQAGALDAIDARLLDVAIVDIELDVEAGGKEVLRKFARSAPDTPLIVYTRYVDPAHVRDLIDLVNQEPPQVVAIVEKGPLGSGGYDPQALLAPISKLIAEWRSSRVRIQNAELPLELLEARSSRIPGYRDDPVEVAAELDRICRRLFGDVRGLADGAEIGIEFKPIGSEGLSSAITVEAEVSLGDDIDGSPVGGSRCVLKIGPAADIQEEVDRYEQFVKYGVRLRQRVELHGQTRLHALGAVCYSFAGGVFGEELTSLSHLLHSPSEQAMAREAIASLCDTSSRNWYAVQCSKESVLAYAARTYQTDFGACYERLDNSLAKLEHRLRQLPLQDLLGGYISHKSASEDTDGRFEIGGASLAIPRKNVFGSGKFVAAIPACLVHGDMHGSNVMLELEGTGEGNGSRALSRVCLIDYRSAGPGPRATDFVTLQASMRLADAQLIVEEVCGGAVPPRLTEEQLAQAIAVAARRQTAETRMLGALSNPVEVEEGGLSSHWEALDFEITSAMQRNFTDLSLMEYLVAAMPFAFRYFGYPLDQVTRVRFLAWISAQLDAMREATAELTAA